MQCNKTFKSFIAYLRLLATFPRKLIMLSKIVQTVKTDKNLTYHINCGVIQGFLALRKALTTHVKKYRIFSRVLVRLMNERQIHDSQYKVVYRNFLGLCRLKH